MIQDSLIILGIACGAYGVWQWSQPGAWCLVGAALVSVGVAIAKRKAEQADKS